MIASEIQEYYIEVAVWLLVKLLATGLCREIERKDWASFGDDLHPGIRHNHC